MLEGFNVNKKHSNFVYKEHSPIQALQVIFNKYNSFNTFKR